MRYHIGILCVVLCICLIYAWPRIEMPLMKRISVIGISSLLIFTYGLRTWWMGDVIKYHTQFGILLSADWQEELYKSPFNIGTRLLFRFSGLVSGGVFQFCLIVIALFCMTALGITIYRYSVSLYFSYLMFFAIGFYVFNFSGIKQSIAMAFVLLSFKGIVDRNLKYFLIMVFLGSMFHAPAAIFFIAYFWSNKRVDRYYFLVLLMIFAFVLVFRSQIVSFLSEMYYDDEEILTATRLIGGKYIFMVIMLVAALFLRPLHERDRIYKSVFNIMVLATLVQSFSVYGYVFTRLADYFFQFSILFVPFVWEYREHYVKPQSQFALYPRLRFSYESYLLFYGIISVVSLYYFYISLRGLQGDIRDYMFFWNVVNTPWGS